MVGFPGEGEEEYKHLVDFVKEAQFTHLGVFTFSPEEGVKAALMKDRPSKKVARLRRAELMKIQQAIAAKRNQKLIGSTIPVLVENFVRTKKAYLVGRTPFQAPQVDGVVFITKGRAHCGEIVTVKVTDAGPYDLYGEICR